MPDDIDQTRFVLLNNELDKLHGEISEIHDEIRGLTAGMMRLIKLVYKDSDEAKDIKKASIIDQLPDDEALDEFEKNEATTRDIKIAEDSLTYNEVKPFMDALGKIKSAIAQLPTDLELDDCENGDGKFIGGKFKKKTDKFSNWPTEEDLDRYDSAEMEAFKRKIAGDLD